MHPTIYYLQAEWRAAELRDEASRDRVARQARTARRRSGRRWTLALPRLAGGRAPEPRTG